MHAQMTSATTAPTDAAWAAALREQLASYRAWGWGTVLAVLDAAVAARAAGGDAAWASRLREQLFVTQQFGWDAFMVRWMRPLPHGLRRGWRSAAHTNRPRRPPGRPSQAP